MSYINNIFLRANTQKIVSFLLYGTECSDTKDKSYKERLDEVGTPLFEAINEHFHDKTDRENFEQIVLDSWIEYESVFLEIGIIIGAKLTSQYIINTEKG